MAFHENAGPGQVDFDLSFLKSPFPSWREGLQSGPERSRARSLRRSEPLTARTDLLPFRQEGKGPSLRDSCSFLFFPFLHAPTNPVAALPSALLVSDFCFARCKLGVLVSAALQSQLEQSPYLNLISDNNFRALIKSPESASLQDELRACVKLEGQVLLKGRILSLAQGYQVTLSAWRCANGRLLTTEKAVASSQATILPALDLAGESMRRRLGEPEASVRRFNVPTVQAATPSLAALKAFNLGEEKRFTGDWALAVASYKLAVDLDPQFAIAYGRLGIVYYNTAQFVLSAQAFQRAFELRDTRTSDRERLYLITLYYRFATGQIKQTIEDYELWRALYPRDVAPIHNLAAQYLSIGQPQRALDLGR